MMHNSILASTLLVASHLLAPVALDQRDGTTDLIVTGKVSSAVGGPIHGANVHVTSLGLSVGTDAAGVYQLAVPARLRGKMLQLRVRAIGYAPQMREVRLSRDTTAADFTLKQDVMALEQVVVTKGAAAAGLYGGGPTVLMRSRASADGALARDRVPGDSADPRRDLGGEDYARIVDNPFRSPLAAPRSTFGVDVDRASYSNVRRIITVDRQHPPKDAVRIEELINYFPYEQSGPTDDRPFAVTTDVAAAPWAPEHLLVRIGLQARAIDLASAPANNLVFLIDVSGSMQSDDKLPLLKQAFRMLVAQLREQDRVAIVVYASSEGLALASTSGADKPALLAAIDRLEAGGSTAGGAGIRLAYDIAKAQFITGGNNRVILATDGDFNVGTTSNAELERLVEARRREGTALTVLGFGAGNLKDERMEMLADKGNGNYAYIDSPLEARKVLVHEIGGTLVTVAKDVKLQVEFNPGVVAGYRLIGYENRVLRDEDFKDDTKDAGDMGSGHTVTALYEIIPVGASDAARVPRPDSLRYLQSATVRPSTAELMHVRFRYKAPDDAVSIPMDVIVPSRVAPATSDFRFAQAVAAFGMVLRDSEYKGTASAAMVLELASGALGSDRWGYRADFMRLVSAYSDLPRATAERGSR
jgi:Ca-activated chloride channel family protein